MKKKIKIYNWEKEFDELMDRLGFIPVSKIHEDKCKNDRDNIKFFINMLLAQDKKALKYQAPNLQDDLIFEFNQLKPIGDLYVEIEVGRAEEIHVALRNWVVQTLQRVKRQKFKECLEPINNILDGMGMKLPPKNEDDRPFAEGFNEAVKYIKDQIENL